MYAVDTVLCQQRQVFVTLVYMLTRIVLVLVNFQTKNTAYVLVEAAYNSFIMITFY